MSQSSSLDQSQRHAPLHLDADAFRHLGHQLVDAVAARLAAIPSGPVTPGERPGDVRAALDATASLPENGTDAAALLDRATRLVFDHSLFNGHPRFFGYITSSPAPIGILGDLLAAAVNPNVGAWTLSPMATEIELQAVRWIGEFIGFPAGAGLMVSGGNVANMACFYAARAAKAVGAVRERGVGATPLRVYASAETHTWLQKAADLAGLGTDAIRWIRTDARQRMDVDALVSQIDADVKSGDVPMIVIGTAGSVSTGAVDPLTAIAAICRERSIWFHVDGAYGGFAAALPDASADLKALAEADSVAVDPHKWLYAPLEAGCALVRDADALRRAFAFHPPYYHFDAEVTNLYEQGPQNSRGFRALKVWLALQHAGAAGYRQMIADDIALARLLADLVTAHGEFEPFTCDLSIATFRFVPSDLRTRIGDEAVEAYLDDLNRVLLDTSQEAGQVFVSNAVIRGRYALRACIVNFHTTEEDVRAVPELLASTGREIDREKRPAHVR